MSNNNEYLVRAWDMRHDQQHILYSLIRISQLNFFRIFSLNCAHVEWTCTMYKCSNREIVSDTIGRKKTQCRFWEYKQRTLQTECLAAWVICFTHWRQIELIRTQNILFSIISSELNQLWIFQWLFFTAFSCISLALCCSLLWTSFSS